MGLTRKPLSMRYFERVRGCGVRIGTMGEVVGTVVLVTDEVVLLLLLLLREQRDDEEEEVAGEGEGAGMKGNDTTDDPERRLRSWLLQ